MYRTLIFQQGVLQTVLISWYMVGAAGLMIWILVNLASGVELLSKAKLS